MTKIIGLTGGIGSGKTLIAKYIESKGIPVYIADDEARKVMDGAEIIDAIRSKFGDSVIENGKINRPALAQAVFGNADKLAALNAIVHPAVRSHFTHWVKEHQHHPILVKEAAI